MILNRFFAPAAGLLFSTAIFLAGCSDGSDEAMGPDSFPGLGGNLANQNYSSLGQINTSNVNDLGGAWMTRLEPDSAPSYQQSSAVVVDGVLYVETTQGGVHAVDGMTGERIWTFDSGYGQSLRRGVAVGDGMVFTTGNGRHVIALDKDSGKVVWDVVLEEPTIGSQIKVGLVFADGKVLVGSNDGTRGAGFALDATNGALLWKFYGVPGPGEFGNDTWEGDSWMTGGASPWMHPAVDLELGLVYWAFGNARNSPDPEAWGTAVDGSMREGENLFANSLVAMDLDTGEYRWHFQSVHHDIWDLDNVMAPVLIDLEYEGEDRQAVVYGSKTALTYILDRTDGTPLIGIEEVEVPQDASQKTWPTQPIPVGDPMVPTCSNVEGIPATQAPPYYVAGCLFDPHTDMPVAKSPGTGGGTSWSAQSYSHDTGLFYIPGGIVNTAQSVPTGGVGFRPPGQFRSGVIVAKDPATNRNVWVREMPWALAHGNGVLTTAGGLIFVGQPDGYLKALDARNGEELWSFQTGAGVHTSPISYSIDGVQYIAVFAGGNGLPYRSPRGDFLWAFRLGGDVAEAESPVPPSTRQPVNGAIVDGSTVNNKVVMGRIWSALSSKPGDEESLRGNSYAPQILKIKVGETVTFTNPSGNKTPRCATQFFEKLFDIGPLAPGESGEYTFNTTGEFYFNDCTNPQNTGVIIVE